MMRLIHTNQTQAPAAIIAHEPFDTQPRFPLATGENTDWIQTILSHRAISIYLQPLVSLSHGGIIGYEALARGPENSPFFQADALFGAAAQAGLTLEMEALCVAHALRQLPLLPAHTQLFVNAGPSLLARGALGALLHASPLRHHFHGLVMEITEHEPFADPALLRQAIRDLHALGISVALDDFGCGFTDLKTVKYLRPDIVKITLEMIRNGGPAAESARRLSSLCSLPVQPACAARRARGCGRRGDRGTGLGRGTMRRALGAGILFLTAPPGAGFLLEPDPGPAGQ